MKTYEGMRCNPKYYGTLSRARVLVNGKPLSAKPSQNINNHSPDGFNWGYRGSGPAQLALAILLDHSGPKIACEYYQRFKRAFVSQWSDSWRITGKEIDDWLAEQQVAAKLQGV